MADCPECKAQVPDEAGECPHCGAKIIRGDSLEKIAVKTTTWQKVVIAAGIIVLIGIAFTFENAGQRENRAAYADFERPLAKIIRDYTAQTGIGREFGLPGVKFDATTKTGNVYLEFPSGPMGRQQAKVFAQMICASLAKTYVAKGYMPRRLLVYISCLLPDGRQLIYGRAVYNGDLDKLSWENAAEL